MLHDWAGVGTMNPRMATADQRAHPPPESCAQQGEIHEEGEASRGDAERRCEEIVRLWGRCARLRRTLSGRTQTGGEKLEKDPEILAVLSLGGKESEGDEAESQSGHLDNPINEFSPIQDEPHAVAQGVFLAEAEVGCVKAGILIAPFRREM